MPCQRGSGQDFIGGDRRENGAHSGRLLLHLPKNLSNAQAIVVPAFLNMW